MKRSRYFVTVLVLVGFAFVAPVSCFFSPEQSPQTQDQNREQEQIIEEGYTPVGREIICESSNDVFEKVMRSDTTLLLMADPVSDEEAPEIRYRYELLDRDQNCIETGYFKVINPRLEEEVVATGTEPVDLKLSTTKKFMGWDGIRYSGSKVQYTYDKQDLGSWRNRIASCCSIGNRWELWILYAGRNYNGKALYVYCGFQLPVLPPGMYKNAESIRDSKLVFNPWWRPFNPFNR